MSDVSREVFDRKVEWPKPNKRVRAEELSHPAEIPDHWDDQPDIGIAEDEIGYEGER